MINIHNTRPTNGLQAPVIETWESSCYALEAERESRFFGESAQAACGDGPWAELGDWLFGRTRLAEFAARVFGSESSLLVFLVQAWVSRFDTSEHLATNADTEHVQACVFLMVRALRFVAPDAARKAMRDDS